MSENRTPPDDAAMADILASIRRIVSEEQDKVATTSAAPPGPQGEILDLTAEMRVTEGAPQSADPPTVATHGASTAATPRPPETQLTETPSAPDAGDVELDLADLPVDEAQIADIVRAVLREEMDGALGRAISKRVRDISREEIARAFEEFAADD